MRISDRVRHANFRQQPATPEPQPFWVRHPHVMGVSTLAFFIILALLI